MRRHHNHDNISESSSSVGQCHPRMNAPTAKPILPTTLGPTIMQARKGSRRRNNEKGQGFLVQKEEFTTINANFVKAFAVVGVLLLLGVHIYLLQQFSRVTQIDSTHEIPREEHQASESALSRTNNTRSKTPTRILTELSATDREQYTIRINTWQRLDQLLVSIEHHASCPGVAQIQVVWCDPIEPPASLLAVRPDKVIVERHKVNSLNERFHILPSTPTPTLGILSIDDDVLRPCQAIDSGFLQWTKSPHRMVGFDFRLHVEDDDGSWKYGYLSTTQKSNRYSMSLPRYAFLHRDYLDWYFADLPRPIFDQVAESFNCEDIAMSFFVSSHTNGRPPLLAHFWAIETMVKLYVPKKISGTKNHKALRDACVETFAQQLGLKDHLYAAPILHRNDTMFYCGDNHYQIDFDNLPILGKQSRNGDGSALLSQRLRDHNKDVNEWRSLALNDVKRIIAKMKAKTSAHAKEKGLLEHGGKE